MTLNKYPIGSEWLNEMNGRIYKLVLCSDYPIDTPSFTRGNIGLLDINSYEQDGIKTWGDFWEISIASDPYNITEDEWKKLKGPYDFARMDRGLQKQPTCECPIMVSGCTCGVMEAEMEQRGFTKNRMTRLWEPKC